MQHNLLENHNFTIEEDTPLEVEVALDPEMLGKVFENLLEEEERGQSGTFYTPRPVVAFMYREALAAYLTRETSIAGEPLGWLLDEAETGEPVRDAHGQPLLNTHSLPRTLRERADRALEQVRVLAKSNIIWPPPESDRCCWFLGKFALQRVLTS